MPKPNLCLSAIATWREKLKPAAKLTLLATGLTVLPALALACKNHASDTAHMVTGSCIPGEPKSAPGYDATMWYRDSAEKIADYNQTFALGQEKIAAKVKHKHLKSGTWGIILDIDETVLDNSEYQKRSILSCSKTSEAAIYSFMEEKISTATPGAVKLTCGVQKMGGKVVLVTNRNGSFDDKIQAATVDNLKLAKICFDNVIFAKNVQDSNKTPRFKAVINGNYTNILATNQLPGLNIIAYFGDNIQDFPNIEQIAAYKKSPDSSFYGKFGQEYFVLPNPTYGSWQKNQFN